MALAMGRDPAMSIRTLRCPQSTPQTHLPQKKKGQLLKIHPQLLCFVAAQHRELGTAGAKGVCNQRQKEAEPSGEKTRSEPLDLHCTHGVHGSAAEKKRHQGIRKTGDLGGGTRMINAVEGQGYDMGR